MGAALAHELNQPLTAIDLFLAAADRQLSEDPEKARDIFQRVRDEAARAGNIVRRIREMVERTDGERTHFLLSEVIEGAVDLCRVVDRSGTAITATQVPAAVLFGQPTEIRMILVNLIKNALDATEGQQTRRVLIRSEVTDKVRVEVLDNGPGVSLEIAERLFEPFSSTKDDGLGIGLSICRTIAEGHGGRLINRPKEETEDGLGGACFSLTLPLAEEAGHE
nr:ATP-binding protein [Parvularcula mediterranea]